MLKFRDILLIKGLDFFFFQIGFDSDTPHLSGEIKPSGIHGYPLNVLNEIDVMKGRPTLFIEKDALKKW